MLAGYASQKAVTLISAILLLQKKAEEDEAEEDAADATALEVIHHTLTRNAKRTRIACSKI